MFEIINMHVPKAQRIIYDEDKFYILLYMLWAITSHQLTLINGDKLYKSIIKKSKYF
jgi:hypothetical protein